jgi:hypothetical protein
VQGNGSQTVFDYNFIIPSPGAAELYLSDEEAGLSYLLPASSWSLSGVNNPLGGTFTYPRDTSGSPLKETQKLTLRRVVPNTQNTALTNQSGYTPKTVEGGLDWVVMQVQQIAADLANVLRLWPANEAIPPLPFLSAADRANKIVGFDGGGAPMFVSGPVAQALVSPFGGTLIAAPSPSAARDVLGVSPFGGTLIAADTAAAARGVLGVVPAWGGTAGGTANALTVSIDADITSYYAGLEIDFISGASTNTGPVTLNVNSLGAVSVNKGDGTAALAAGDMPASAMVTAVHDGARFRLVAPAALGVGVFAAGTAALPGLAVSGDPNTGIFSPGPDALSVAVGGDRLMDFFQSSGLLNSKVGDAEANHWIRLNDASAVNIRACQYGALNENTVNVVTMRAVLNTDGSANLEIYATPPGARTSDRRVLRVAVPGSGPVQVYNGLDVSGNLRFDNGYGSVAQAFGCRAWVNFNGTGTVAIRASGNVSSITDKGTGDYTVNFTTAMPDANYAAFVMATWDGGPNFSGHRTTVGQTTGGFRAVSGLSGGSAADSSVMTAFVFR